MAASAFEKQCDREQLWVSTSNCWIVVWLWFLDLSVDECTRVTTDRSLSGWDIGSDGRSNTPDLRWANAVPQMPRKKQSRCIMLCNPHIRQEHMLREDSIHVQILPKSLRNQVVLENLMYVWFKVSVIWETCKLGMWPGMYWPWKLSLPPRSVQRVWIGARRREGKITKLIRKNKIVRHRLAFEQASSSLSLSLITVSTNQHLPFEIVIFSESWCLPKACFTRAIYSKFESFFWYLLMWSSGAVSMKSDSRKSRDWMSSPSTWFLHSAKNPT